VVVGIEHMGKRYLKHTLDLGRIEPQRQIGLQDADYRRHAIAGNHQVIRQKSEYLDVAARETNFFLRFAQRGGHRTPILRLDPAARKTDLPAVGFKVGSPLREQNRRAVSALDKRHEHCRRNRLIGEKLPQASASLGRNLAVPPIIDRGVTRLAQQTSAQSLPQIGRGTEHEGSIGHGV